MPSKFEGLGLSQLGNEMQYAQGGDGLSVSKLLGLFLAPGSSETSTSLTGGGSGMPVQPSIGLQPNFGGGGVGIKPNFGGGGQGLKPVGSASAMMPITAQSPAQNSINPGSGQDLDGDGQIDEFWRSQQ